jgi:hypothetical protein
MVAETRRGAADPSVPMTRASGVRKGGAADAQLGAAPDAARTVETPVEQAAAVEQSLERLLAKPTLLLTPSKTEREAVLQASSLLFQLARRDADRRSGAGAAKGLRKLHTAGCDAEQVWGQLEVGGLTEHEVLKREVKTLLKSQDLVNLVPEEDEDEDEDERRGRQGQRRRGERER